MFCDIILGMTKLKQNLDRKMKEQGFNMNSLARRADMEVTAIKHIIGGQTLNPKIDTIAKIAKALHCSIEELLYGENIIDGKNTFISINNDREIWKKCVKIVDELIAESVRKNDITSDIKAELYIACYEFQLEGISIHNINQLNTILKFIKN